MVGVAELVCVPVAVTVPDALGVSLSESGGAPDDDGLDPAVRELVGVLLSEREAVRDVDCVGVGVEVAVPVDELVGDTLDDTVDVVDADAELLGVCEGDAPIVREDVGDSVPEELADVVLEGVTEDVPVLDPVADDVPESVGVTVALGLSESERVGDADAEADAVGVPDAVPPLLSVVVGVAVAEEETLGAPAPPDRFGPAEPGAK